MGETQIGVQIDKERKTATIEIMAVGQPVSSMELSLDQLTKLIGLLGETRSRMLEGSPMRRLEGEFVRTITEPNWYIQMAKIDGSLLAFDHPAFGPISFAIPKREIAQIVRILNTHLALPAMAPGKSN